MSREVRRVPLNWQHPMHWRERWDQAEGRTRMRLVPVALWGHTYAEAMTGWQSERDDIINHRGDWAFSVEWYLTGYQGRDDDAPVVHPFSSGDGETVTPVRDENHLEELLLANHDRAQPDPSDYMPDFSGAPESDMGLCMYETTSEGTPMSPTFRTPEELARWLTENDAPAFAGETATYGQWLATCTRGWAPSAIFTPATGLQSGVAAMGAA